MKKGTKSRNAGGRLKPLLDPDKVSPKVKRKKPKMGSIKEVFKK